MKKTLLFEPGAIFDEAGIKIVRVAEYAPKKTDQTRYEVVYLCCEKSGFLSHARIRTRMNERFDKCQKCASRVRFRESVQSGPVGLPIKNVPSLEELGLIWPAPPLAVRLFQEERDGLV